MTTSHYIGAPLKVNEREDFNLEIFNEANPYSIASMLPENTREKVLRNVDRELLGMDEFDLRTTVKPTPTCNKLRLAFWFEYDSAVRAGRKIDVKRIHAGICSAEMWNKEYCKPKRLAWILTPVSSYQASMEEALEFSIAQMRKMLEAPLFKEDGRLDTAAANTIIRVFSILDQRVHGAIVQKIETKSLVVNKQVKAGPGDQAPAIDIDEKLRVLQTQLNQNNKLIMGVPSGPTEESEQEV